MIVNVHGHVGYMSGSETAREHYSRDNVLDHLRRSVYYGVGVVQSLGTDRDAVEIAIRDAQRSGRLDDPQLAALFTAGAGLAVPTPGSTNGGPSFATDVVLEAATPEAARRHIRRLAEQRPDIVKIWVDDRGGTKRKLQPDVTDPAFRDELSDLVREGARRIIAQAVEAELKGFLEAHPEARDGLGRRAVVRNGYPPRRQVLTGVGPVTVRLAKTRDRGGEGRCCRSQVLPLYLKKTRRLEAVIPGLYLKGVWTNEFDEALQALFGESVKGLSPTTISRLKRGWESEYAAWRSRDWQGHEFVYLWADGVYTHVRAEERRCILVLVGCDVHGRKHFLAIEDGFRESTESWKALLVSLRDRGLKPTRLAIGDGALGFWAALAQVCPQTREQRCWVHKTVNVLDKLPKRLQGPAKSALHEIWQADSRAAAHKAFDRFVATYEDKYPRAVDCLVKDRAALLAFYNFPAAHFQHIRTTHPIESTFATIRLRTTKTRNCVSAKSGLSLMHQLAMSAQKRWRRLRGFRQLADVVAGVKFIDGVDERTSRKAA